MKIHFNKLNIIKISVLIGILVSVLSCDKNENTGPNVDYSVALPRYFSFDTLERQYKTYNQFIYNIMKSAYLWNDQVPQIDYTQAKYTNDNGEALLRELAYKKLDKFSFIVDKESNDAFFEEGQSNGDKGISYGADNALRIAFVYPGSPADMAGIYRGMKVERLNGKDAIAAVNDESIYDILDEKTIEFDLVDSLGRSKTISVSDGSYKLKTVPTYKVVQSGGKKIGYVLFTSFLSTSEAELKEAFSSFKNNKIDELVVDLRYNGGGYVYISAILAAMIGGNKVKDKVFCEFKYNKMVTKEYLNNEREVYGFEEVDESVDIDRVFFITSEGTASASELTINSLKPYLDVKLIGDNTFGKPVGFPGFGYKDKVLYAVMFSTVNADGEGDYYNGIRPNRYAIDDFSHQLGDIKEKRFSEAINYINNGTFASGSREEFIQQKYIQLYGISAIRGTR